MSAVVFGFDKTEGKIRLALNGEEIPAVSAVNIAVSRLGSICTVVFEANAVDCNALIDRLAIAEEVPSEHGVS